MITCPCNLTRAQLRGLFKSVLAFSFTETEVRKRQMAFLKDIFTVPRDDLDALRRGGPHKARCKCGHPVDLHDAGATVARWRTFVLALVPCALWAVLCGMTTRITYPALAAALPGAMIAGNLIGALATAAMRHFQSVIDVLLPSGEAMQSVRRIVSALSMFGLSIAALVGAGSGNTLLEYMCSLLPCATVDAFVTPFLEYIATRKNRSADGVVATSDFLHKDLTRHHVVLLHVEWLLHAVCVILLVVGATAYADIPGDVVLVRLVISACCLFAVSCVPWIVLRVNLQRWFAAFRLNDIERVTAVLGSPVVTGKPVVPWPTPGDETHSAAVRQPPSPNAATSLRGNSEPVATVDYGEGMLSASSVSRAEGLEFIRSAPIHQRPSLSHPEFRDIDYKAI
jgi:uncharacterized membrane protein